jgi:hypothetical protein
MKAGEKLLNGDLLDAGFIVCISYRVALLLKN